MNLSQILYAPIKHMSKVYRTRYHLNYVHARKLFVFDILLLFSTVLLIASTIFWYTYDPTIEDLVVLHIEATDEVGTPLTRIPSGAPVRYTITYENQSEAIMTRPQLRLIPPEYFQITTITAHNLPYDTSNHTFSLPDLAPEQGGTISVDGVYFGTPDKYEHVSVILSYIQDGRTALEATNSTIISSLRDAVLKGSLEIPTVIRGTGTYPITLTLTNTGELPLSDIVIPSTSPLGDINWQTTPVIPSLTGSSTATLSGTLTLAIPRSQRNLTLSLTPNIRIDGTHVPQDPLTATAAVVHPSLTIDTPTWASLTASPGDTVPLSLTITNTGDTTIDDLHVQLPLNSNIVDLKATAKLHANSTLEGTRLLLPLNTSLAPGATYSATLPIQLRSVPNGGTDVVLTISPIAEGTAPGGTTLIQTTAESTNIAIGTALFGEAHSRYYTNEGDQLGRGPLPPQVDEETKYWALITLQNTTSRVDAPRFVATLGPHVTWTGRSSVSLGNDIAYNASTNQISWSWNSLAAGQTVGLYMELAVTPRAADIGAIPLLLTQMRFNGYDTYIERDVSRSLGNISADLLQDERGRTRGVTVQ